MDVRFSAEQRALRDSVTQVVRDLGPRTVAALDDHERAAKLDAAVAAAGWRELRQAAAEGQPFASGVEAAIIAEELGRGLADVSFLGPTLAAELRRIVGAPPTLEPETVLLSTDLTRLATTPEGLAPEVWSDQQALFADATLCLVRVGRAAERVDLTRPAGVVSSGVVTVVEGQHRALDHEAMTRWTALGLALSAADLVGAMSGAIALACAYASDRRQFGKPVGSFQAVQHLLADAHVATEGSRSAVLHAAWAVDALDPVAALDASAIAKAYAARAARTVCETVIQVHGGIGNTWDCLAHVYLRRCLFSTDVLGGVDANLGRVLAHVGLGERDGLR